MLIAAHRPSIHIFQRADWGVFKQLTTITDATIDCVDISDTFTQVTETILYAADVAIPKSSSRPHTNLADTRVLLSEPFCFPPWNVTSVAHMNPFIGFNKAHADPFIFQQLYLTHRSQYDNYKAIFTDGSKMAHHVGFGVIIDEDTYSHTLPIYSSVFTAEVTAYFFIRITVVFACILIT
ncbi:hypothetical protein AVEN_66818-1 [Araneus ventricosus]|uniref:RNase H type-1 domain-containing protein n=1 Tax=Araneus ventricosus TaxID=182803 RepID=A0A4Y2DRL8_ARAVE|nr:hypothetical protein AVEN_66818-1 [Araneus ventricosus]